MSLAAGTRLGPYEIVAPIGAGGMGEVYRARDERLKRDVAIKVLPSSFSSDPDRLRRFEKEAQAASALNHPNITAVYDIGSHDGAPYIVTELLEGETLRARLDWDALAPGKAINYAAQIAKGLAAAHERGIVHRDLKPENLFVMRDGRVKILDFGLAKRVEAIDPEDETGAPTASGHTEPGTVMGTAGYMSPEQVRGLPVDHRSDIFSFGTILYELLSGKRAFRRDTRAETMSAILREEPPELSESGRNISLALNNVVRHCLEKDRDDRFQSAKDIVFALSEASGPAISSGARAASTSGGAPAVTSAAGLSRLLIAAAVVVVLAAAGVTLLRSSHKGRAETGRVKRVAVLPFENLGSAEDDYFADGIADAVRGKLTSLPGVQVIARNSSTPYKKTTKTPKQIAQELDVGYLLTATVRWQKGTGGASRVEVSPELVEVPNSGAPTSKWQQSFDAALTDVFQVQSDIATRVAQSLGVALGAGEEKRLSERPTQNLAAYDAFLKGEEIWNSARNAPADIRKMRGFYEQAVALDPGFGLAWARVELSASNPERARQAAEKALALAPDRPETYVAVGAYQDAVLHDRLHALEQYARGLRVAPGNALLIACIGVTETSLGRWEAGLEHLRQAETLDPGWPDNQVNLGLALMYLRRYPEAREVLDRGLRIVPTNVQLVEYKAMTFLGEGDLAGARGVLQAVPKEVEPTALVAWVANWFDLVWVLDESQRELLLRLTPGAFDDDKGDWAFCLAQASALKGDAANVRTYADEARKAWEERLRTKPDDAKLHSALGLALAYLGRKEEAIREGQRGVALLPVAKDAEAGPIIRHYLARTYILISDPEKALDQLEPLLKIPYYLSSGWLKIDPNFDPLRKNPRFQKLVAGAK